MCVSGAGEVAVWQRQGEGAEVRKHTLHPENYQITHTHTHAHAPDAMCRAYFRHSVFVTNVLACWRIYAEKHTTHARTQKI